MMVTGCTQSNLDLFTYDLVMPPGLESVRNIFKSHNRINIRKRKIKRILNE
jgi:hypothetical protein